MIATTITTTLLRRHCRSAAPNLLEIVNVRLLSFSLGVRKVTTSTTTNTTTNNDYSEEEKQRSLLLCDAVERFMNTQGGYFSPMKETTTKVLSDDFIFRGPIIGPLTKVDYTEVLEYFRVYEAFPDIKPNCFGFTIDPLNPMKVRFFVQATGTYQRPLGGFMGKFAATVSPPDGRNYRGSTEAWSITFNDLERMQVKCITAGYVVDRFEETDDDLSTTTTTGGKGLSFGILHTIGIPLPTTPGAPSLRLTQWVTNKFSSGPNAFFPKAFSNTIPKWWKDARRGADP